MIFPETLWLTLAALTLEALLSYPNWLFRFIGHPVSWIGRLIDLGDRKFNTPRLAPAILRERGSMLLICLLTLVLIIAVALDITLSGGLIGLGFEALIASTLLAQRSLYDHVQAVAKALDGPIEIAREKVAMIVGRNVETLDREGVARAAIESLAENFADGVVAPSFWMALLGLPGAALYKTINTADSMIGHRTPRYLDFGRAAAKVDDIANWIAARLAAFLLVCAAAFTRGASARDAWRILRRDARTHASPNAGWPEAAMAGALKLQLGGPRAYGAQVIQAATLGDATLGDMTSGDTTSGSASAPSARLKLALTLYRRALYLQFAGLAALALLLL